MTPDDDREPDEDFDDDDELDDDDEFDEGLERTAVTVEVTGLSLYTHHGVTEAEREIGQRLILDLRFDAGASDATVTDRRRGHRRLRARAARSSRSSRSSARTRRSRRSAPRSPTGCWRTSRPRRSGSRRRSPSRRSRCPSSRSPSRSGGPARSTDVTAFDEATAVAAARATGPTRRSAIRDWSAPNGPNGGYLAAIVLRAMAAELDDPSRPARSITLHYLRPPQPGEVRIDVVVERSGRTLSTLTRAPVAGRPALRDRRRRLRRRVPAVARPLRGADAGRRRRPRRSSRTPAHERLPPIARRLVLRGAIGAPPFSGADEALTGGWMSLHEPQPVDAAALALYADGWLPAAFTALTAPGVRADGGPDDPLPQPGGRRRARARRAAARRLPLALRRPTG